MREINDLANRVRNKNKKQPRHPRTGEISFDTPSAFRYSRSIGSKHDEGTMTTVTVNTSHLSNATLHLLQLALSDHGGEIITVRNSITTAGFGTSAEAKRFRDDATVYGVPATLIRG